MRDFLASVFTPRRTQWLIYAAIAGALLGLIQNDNWNLVALVILAFCGGYLDGVLDSAARDTEGWE